MLAVESFNSYEYFFNFLALSLLTVPCYFALPTATLRRVLMTVMGVYLVYFIAPRLVVFYVIFWTAVYFAHRFAFIELKGASNAKKYLAILALIMLPLLPMPMIFWKILEDTFTFNFIDYMNRAVAVFSTRAWEVDTIRPLLVPIGLSFATFRAIDLLIKTDLGKITGLSYGQVMFYGFYPPVQVIGPIIEWEEVQNQDERPTPAAVLDGLVRIAVGFIKIFVIAGLLESNTQIFASPHDWPTWALWLKLIGYSWYFYLNFSGYSDVAIGAAALYGHKLKENFSFAYFRPNIQAFWNNWHMSLTRWAQRNVFVPAGGYRAKTQYFALFLTMMAIALWHNISLTMVIFGIYHFCAQVIYRKHAESRPKDAVATRLQQAGGALLTYTTVLLSLPLLSHADGKALEFYMALAGM